MAKGQNSEEEKIYHWISLCIPGIGIHAFVPMMLVSLALIIRHWEAVREALLGSIPICCFIQAGLLRLDPVFWLFLCIIIIVVLSIKSGLLCVNSSTDQHGDSSSFVKESESWTKQQNVLEGTGMEIREATGKIEWTNSISMTVTVTQPMQKQPSTKRTRSSINGIGGIAQGRGQEDIDMKEPMAQEQALVEYEPLAQDQALVEYEPMVMVDGSDDELRRRFDDFIAKVHHEIRFQSSAYFKQRSYQWDGSIL